ncbi:MAG TPA: hypothetical protein PKZ42_06225 [Syntrophales bacterium]|nr:hypothetical protein [Syntrophales bacterium]
MSFKVIKGTFHVVGYSPDGDSIRFKADNPANWDLLKGGKVKVNAKGHAQLRIEAIDTLETHYQKEHQPEQFALAAMEYLFKLLGIRHVVWNKSRSKVSSADDGAPGYILSRTVEKYGRPVAFLFDGSQDFEDGMEVYLNNKIARRSVNYKLLSKGLAYPTFYDGMFYDLRELFAKRTATVRNAEKGLWTCDTTSKYFGVNGLPDVTDRHVIFPKLFRRIIAYLKENDSFDPRDFLQKLETESEKVLILNTLHFTHLDNLISVNTEGGKIKLRYKPEDIVFLC